MRPDMCKVITERPRYKNRTGTEGRSKERYLDEGSPTRESIRAPYNSRYSRKEFSDHLSPLYRFIASQVGRLWNEVNSEIRAHLHLPNVNAQHFLTHLDHILVVKVVMIDDIPHHANGCYPIHHYSIRGSFYVHPETGRICKVEVPPGQTKKALRAKHPIKKAPPVPEVIYRYTRSGWYEIKLTKLNYQYFPYASLLHPDRQGRYPRSKKFWDLFLGRYVSYGDSHCRESYGGDYYASEMHLLSAREVRRRGLVKGKVA